MIYSMAVILSLMTSLSLPTAGMPMVERVLASLPKVKRIEDSAGANIGLWVGPDGTIISCVVRSSAGNANIAAQFCEPLIGYRMQKPTAADGTPSYGYVKTTVFAFPDGRQLPQVWLRELQASRTDEAEEAVLKVAAPDWSPRSNIFLLVEVSEEGKVAACKPGSPKSDKTLAAEACAGSIGRVLEKRTAADGRPVSYVRSLGLIAS